MYPEVARVDTPAGLQMKSAKTDHNVATLTIALN